MMFKEIETAEKNAFNLIRVMAAFMIIICHVFGYYSESPLTRLSQVFNAAVPVFFLLSGFLNSSLKIDTPFQWIKKKCIRILIPYYVYILLSSTIFCLIDREYIDMEIMVNALFNVQGFSHKYMVAGGHLWYLSVIMFLYLITPILTKLREKQSIIFIIAMLVLQYMLCFFPSHSKEWLIVLSNYITYLLVYFLGMYMHFQWERSFHIKQYISLTIVMFVANGVRLVTQILDGYNMGDFLSRLYAHIIAIYSQSILGIWIFMTIFYLGKTLLKNCKDIKILDFLSRISYEVYIVHNMFVEQPLSVLRITDFPIINIIILIIVSVLAAWGLNILSGKVISKLRRVL